VCLTSNDLTRHSYPPGHAWLVALLCLACRFGNAQAPDAPVQQAPTGGFTLHVETRLVPLDVTVQDRQGHFINDLHASDFSVSDNNVPQKLTSFEAPFEHTLPHNISAAQLALGDAKAYGSSALDIIVLDELNTPFEATVASRMAIRKYLSAEPKQLSQPTMLVAINDAGFQMLVNYTTDSQTLIAELDAHRATLPAKLQMGALDKQLAETFRAIDQIALASEGLPQRKNLLWVGNGFSGINTEQLDSATQQQLAALVEHMTNRLLAARVTVYKVDPNGVTIAGPDQSSGDSGVSTGAGPYDAALNFNTFVTQTGGAYFYSRNDLGRALAEGVSEGSHFYSMAYRPSNLSEDTPYHRITLATRDPKLVVHVRAGYYTNGDRTADAPLTTALTELNTAAMEAIPYTGLAVAVSSLDRGGPDKLSHCHLLLNADRLTWQPTEDGSHYTGELLIGSTTFSAKNRVLNYSAQRFTVTLSAAQYDARAKLQPSFAVEVSLPPGAAALRIVVRDQGNGHLGSTEMRPIPNL